MKFSHIKKIIAILLIFHFIFLSNYSFADNNSSWCMWNQWFESFSSNCIWKSGFELYECRVTNICKPCINNWSQKLFQTENFEKAEVYRDKFSLTGNKILVPFNDTKNIYSDNMNSIYQCSLINSQERWLKVVKEKLLKIDRTWILRNNIEAKINSQELKLEAKKNALKCWWAWKNNSNWLFQKKEVLDETTYELCRYTFYLDYLKWYYSNVSNLAWVDTNQQTNQAEKNKKISVKGINDEFFWAVKKIEEQEKHIYKVFPLAFEAYNEYENNFQIHFILTIIREDYIIVRNLLAQTLWPINQLVYKIKDAMSLN